FGEAAAVRTAYAAASARFATVLDELCAELALLRAPARPVGTALTGAVARRMYKAVAPYAGSGFVTPMAAVAGAVAEEILAAMTGAATLARAYVNNGGDIALHLAPGTSLTAAVVARPDRPTLLGTARIDAADPVRGIATSGRHGRSFSLGIADSVTVLARSAAMADAGATMIGNAVDLPGHPGIERAPAESLQPDSDLGSLPVTRAVAPLPPDEIARALAAGTGFARRLREGGLIVAAALTPRGET